ncbi:MAG TPA: adenylate/guanylate cyclase domain-containing protein [Candidatus Dormibacteraeota bacterium]|nr:adenylate/guanylate cyclase domain-containing protein [Methylomirabilota bacterium]HWN03982.1 adenylate/guanylate cyclase domain-containing protein [Candidatus Dormibacteraeota bacterium]
MSVEIPASGSSVPAVTEPAAPVSPEPAAIRVPLKVKLSLLITALVVLAVALVGLFLLRQQQQSLTAEMTKRGLTMAENFAAGAKTPLLTGDDLTLGVLVTDAMKDPDVSYVIVADHDGRVLAHSDPQAAVKSTVDRPKGLEPLKDRLLVQIYKTPQGRVIDFAVPLVYSGVPVGALYLGFSEEAITAALASARNQALVITLVMVLAGLGGAVGLAALLSRPIFRLVQATGAIAAGNFNITLPVASRDELGVLTDSFNRMARSLREKEMIKRAFTRYVAREVVEEILKNPENMALTGERREVTVLFCDVRGFTPLSERLSPEEVVLLLNDFYNLMIETTFKHDGTLDKFLGDAVMAVFGAPLAHPDHSARAIRTAVAMREGIVGLNERRARDGKEPIAVGIGVSAGEAVAGTVGTEDRMEYTVIGDSVNLAARLESNAKPGQILISHRTYERVRDLVDARPLGRIRVKGKEEEVEVYEVLRLASVV